MNPNELNSLIGKQVTLFVKGPHCGIIAAGELRINKYGLYSIDISLTPIVFNFSVQDVEKIIGNEIYLK